MGKPITVDDLDIRFRLALEQVRKVANSFAAGSYRVRRRAGIDPHLELVEAVIATTKTGVLNYRDERVQRQLAIAALIKEVDSREALTDLAYQTGLTASQIVAIMRGPHLVDRQLTTTDEPDEVRRSA